MASPTRIDPADDLFAAEALPSGLDYRPDFLSAHDESLLLRELAVLPMAAAPYKAYTARRRVASFGAAYDFDRDRLRTAAVLPDFLTPLAARVARVLEVAPGALAQVLVTEYAPGTPLGWHRDAPVFESIAGVSLASACELQWRRWPPRAREPVLSLRVAPRSLYVMRGESRWGWQHRVPAVKALRYSITFRTLRAPGELRAPALTTA
jgi:alkylated DNA repair dioxygenase AlkB